MHIKNNKKDVGCVGKLFHEFIVLCFMEVCCGSKLVDGAFLLQMGCQLLVHFLCQKHCLECVKRTY
jgi:hypothetical protein